MVLPGWLPDNTGIQWEMSHYGGGTKHHYSFLHSNNILIIIRLSNFDVDIYNFMMDSFKLNCASYRTGTFLY